MRHCRYILLLFILIVENIVAQNLYNLVVTTNRAESSIYIDNELCGSGSCIISVLEGTYLITVIENHLIWNAQTIIDTIKISDAGHNVVKEYHFKNKVRLTTNPFDASVYFNNKFFAYTPCLVPRGIKLIDIKKENYRYQSKNLENTGNIVDIDLTPLEKIKNKDDSFISSGWFPVLLGTACALGAAAAYYKLEADKNFDKYYKTNNRNLLEKVDKYDMYSGVAFGLLQINFGYLAYKFLFDSQ
ncbi:MAG: PEGA domain-containing protein [Melioribacteraceae bacterium]|nr:PEGA domain-containing protein [Melioribacteraceae bacterium]